MDSLQLRDYFSSADGFGVLSTADSQGHVNSALYATPRFLEDGTLALIMLDRLSHHNLQSNPHASYLFLEHGAGYHGVRLTLCRSGEECNTPRIDTLLSESGRVHSAQQDRFLVFFTIENVLPLVSGTAKECSDA